MVKKLARNILEETLNSQGYDLIYHGSNSGVKNYSAIEYGRLAHLAHILDFCKINCVFDVGANEGQYGKSLRKLGFSGYIFSFEPVAETYSKLKAEAESDPRWRVYNFALGSENCVKEINVFGASVFNSFLCPAATPKDVYSHPDFNTFNHQMVSVKTLDSVYDEVVEQIEDECRPFIKLDTQGFDLEVVKGGKAVLGKMLGLQVELSFVPIYDEMPDYVSSLKTFELLGFHVTNFFPVSNELPPIEFDCVMIAAKAFQQNKTKQG